MEKKKVKIWDTYVTKKDGTTMHFDIVAPAEITERETIFSYGKEYLNLMNQSGQPLSSDECKFCHIEDLNPQWEKKIRQNGYFIIPMEGCN